MINTLKKLHILFIYGILFCFLYSCTKPMKEEELDDIQFKLVMDTLSKNTVCVEEAKLILKYRDTVFKRTTPEVLDYPLKFRVAIIDFQAGGRVFEYLSKEEAKDYFQMEVEDSKLEKAIRDSIEVRRKKIDDFKPSIYPHRRKYSTQHAPLTLFFSRLNKRILVVKVLTTFERADPLSDYYDEFGVQRSTPNFLPNRVYYFFFDKDLKKIQKMFYIGPR